MEPLWHCLGEHYDDFDYFGSGPVRKSSNRRAQSARITLHGCVAWCYWKPDTPVPSFAIGIKISPLP